MEQMKNGTAALWPRRWWGRIKHKAVDATVEGGLKELIRPLLGPLGVLAAPYLVSLPPIIGKYLTGPVPVWAFVSLALVVVGLVIVVIRQRHSEPSVTSSARRAPSKFSHKGLDWVLGPDFWGTYEHDS